MDDDRIVQQWQWRQWKGRHHRSVRHNAQLYGYTSSEQLTAQPLNGAKHAGHFLPSPHSLDGRQTSPRLGFFHGICAEKPPRHLTLQLGDAIDTLHFFFILPGDEIEDSKL